MDANRIIGRPKAYNMGYRLLSPGDNLLEPKSTRNHRLRAAQKRQANRQEGEGICNVKQIYGELLVYIYYAFIRG